MSDQQNSDVVNDGGQSITAWERLSSGVFAWHRFDDAHITRLLVAFPFNRTRWPRRLAWRLLLDAYVRHFQLEAYADFL